jgi:hypothetical protein
MFEGLIEKRNIISERISFLTDIGCALENVSVWDLHKDQNVIEFMNYILKRVECGNEYEDLLI